MTRIYPTSGSRTVLVTITLDVLNLMTYAPSTEMHTCVDNAPVIELMMLYNFTYKFVRTMV